MADARKPGSHPLVGWMAGTVTVGPGVDLTGPADPYWSLDFDTFIESLKDNEPPRGVHDVFNALWWARKGDWDRAHRLVMRGSGKECAWVHALLHRTEGDLDNARYWYARAGRPQATGDLNAEWEAILIALLATQRALS